MQILANGRKADGKTENFVFSYRLLIYGQSKAKLREGEVMRTLETILQRI